MEDGEAVERVRAFYRCLDEGRYGELERMLHPEFVQVRPDRRFEGRAAFVRFMREDRPIQDSAHELHGVFGRAENAETTAIAAEGELRGPDGDRLFGFVDVHEFDGERIARLRTYTS